MILPGTRLGYPSPPVCSAFFQSVIKPEKFPIPTSNYPGAHKGCPYYLGAHKGRPYYPAKGR